MKKRNNNNRRKFWRYIIYIGIFLIIAFICIFGILSFKYGPTAVINKGFSIVNNITTPITEKVNLVINNITGKNKVDYGINVN